MYVYVEESGEYDNDEMTTEYDTFSEVLNQYAKRKSSFIIAYEIMGRISADFLERALSDRESARTAAIVMAKSKLTPEELELLGIK